MKLCAIDDQINEIVNNGGVDSTEKWQIFHKIRRREKLLYEAAIAGWDDFDWQKAHEAGWLHKNDYTIFEELKDLDRRDYKKQ